MEGIIETYVDYPMSGIPHALAFDCVSVQRDIFFPHRIKAPPKGVAKRRLIPSQKEIRYLVAIMK